MYKVYLLTTLLLITGCSAIQPNPDLSSRVSDISYEDTAIQFQPMTMDVKVVADWSDPFVSSDIKVDLSITTPEGNTKTLPGYFVEGKSNSASTWRFIYTPSSRGSYQFTALVSDDENMPYRSQSATIQVLPGEGKGFLHTYDMWSLQYDNGERFRGIGENFGWEARDEDDSKYFKDLNENPRFNYDQMLPKLSEQGANIIRTWMIYWNLPIDWQQTHNALRYEDSSVRFNPSGVERMDELVELAKMHDIKLILSLDSHAGFIGNGWSRNSYNSENGGPADSVLEFFTNEKSKSRYKDKLRFMVAKYSYAPQIAAWEFFNEIDNVMYEGEKQLIPDVVITSWHDEMAKYLASIDPHDHIITTSISHREVNGLFDIDELDLAQSHLYKVTKEIPEVINSFNKEYNKPYFVGEFSAEWDWSQDFNNIPEMESDFVDGLYLGLFSPTPILPLSWWWEYFDEKGTTDIFSTVKALNNRILSDGGAIETASVSNVNSALMTLGVETSQNIYVYVTNPQDSEEKYRLHGDIPLNTPQDILDANNGKTVNLDARNYFTIGPEERHVLIFRK